MIGDGMQKLGFLGIVAEAHSFSGQYGDPMSTFEQSKSHMMSCSTSFLHSETNLRGLLHPGARKCTALPTSYGASGSWQRLVSGNFRNARPFLYGQDLLLHTARMVSIGTNLELA